MIRVNVLVVEDDPAIGELIQFTLEQAGYSVTRAQSAEQALKLVRTVVPAVAVIDWMLPGMPGVSLVRQLRQQERTAELSLIMVTARAEEADRITGLEHGADDYIAKPFSPRELVARVRALVRRRAPESSDEVLSCGPLRLDPTTYQVTVEGRRLEMRLVEFKLLRLLMAYPERVFSRTDLLDRVWGDHVFIEERTVDVHIRRLRLSLGPDLRDMVVTVRSGGYKLTATAEAER